MHHIIKKFEISIKHKNKIITELRRKFYFGMDKAKEGKKQRVDKLYHLILKLL